MSWFKKLCLFLSGGLTIAFFMLSMYVHNSKIWGYHSVSEVVLFGLAGLFYLIFIFLLHLDSK